MAWAGVSKGFGTNLVIIEGFLTANQYTDHILERIPVNTNITAMSRLC